MSEKDNKLAQAITTANQQCKDIHRLILEEKMQWQLMPEDRSPLPGFKAYHGTGGGYTVFIGGVANQCIGSCFGAEAQLTVLRNEFAQFCFEAAEAALAKKN